MLVSALVSVIVVVWAACGILASWKWHGHFRTKFPAQAYMEREVWEGRLWGLLGGPASLIVISFRDRRAPFLRPPVIRAQQTLEALDGNDDR